MQQTRKDGSTKHVAIKRGYGSPPIKPARKGQKYQIGVIVAGPTKKAIVESTKASGRSISREAEHLIERALAYDRILAAMGTTLEKIKEGNLEAELWRSGYTPIRTPHGKLWAPPGYPGIERSGFVAAEPGEVEAMNERVAAAHEQAGVTDEEIERQNREKLEAADARPFNRDAFDALNRRIDEVEEISKAPAKKDDAA
jgi:hypothetical protein